MSRLCALGRLFSDALFNACRAGRSRSERLRILTTVVVGGGPTGTEFAGELADFINSDLAKIDPERARDCRWVPFLRPCFRTANWPASRQHAAAASDFLAFCVAALAAGVAGRDTTLHHAFVGYACC